MTKFKHFISIAIITLAVGFFFAHKAGVVYGIDGLHVTTGGNVGIGTTSPGQKLSVTGAIESTTGGFKFPDGTIQTTAVSGKILNVTIYNDYTRQVLPAASSITMVSFAVNKLSATSILLVQGTISGRGEYTGDMQQGWKYGAGTEVLGQSLMYNNTSYSRIFPTTVSIANHTTTGSQTMTFRYFSASGGSNKPFLVYNPNSSDNNRIGQTGSVYTVWEIDQ